MVNIRSATDQDQHAVLEIYNHAVQNTTATFDTDDRTFEQQMLWFRKHKKNHPVIVAQIDNEIAGWASLSPWSDRCAYDDTVEVSVYVHHLHRGKGIGSELLQVITLMGAELGNHTVISRITSGNEMSIHIHEKFGYHHIGVMKEVGLKFGQRLDVIMMQKIYS